MLTTCKSHIGRHARLTLGPNPISATPESPNYGNTEFYDMTTPTGWDTGLCQDYCRGLALWFASRLDARHVIRRWFGEQRKS